MKSFKKLAALTLALVLALSLAACGGAASAPASTAPAASGDTAATDGPATARCLILVTPDGERTMNTYLGACQGLSPADVDPAAAAGVSPGRLDLVGAVDFRLALARRRHDRLDEAGEAHGLGPRRQFLGAARKGVGAGRQA